MTARGAALSIDFRAANDHSRVTVRSSDGDHFSAQGRLGRSTLAEFRADLDRDLYEFQEKLGSELHQEDWQAVGDAVRVLFKRGRKMCKLIFGDGLADAQLLFSRALRVPGKPGRQWAQIDVRADFRTAPPFELLPILDLTDPPGCIDSVDTLSAVLERFLGFSAIIRRIYRGSSGLDQNTEIDNTPRLNVKFFQNIDLEGSRNELAFLSGHREAIAFDGPWPPNGVGIDNDVAMLAQYLWDPTLHFDHSTNGSADHFHHFACHCDTSGDTSEQHYLLLASDRAVCRASIGEIKDQFVALEVKHPGKQKPLGPIVFLNACASTQVKPNSISSFASLFLFDNHNRAVIGAETALSDTVAAEFSKEFYRCLLEGYTLGESIQLAKWCLLQQCNNPVALIYTMYANPDIKVTHRHARWRDPDYGGRQRQFSPTQLA